MKKIFALIGVVILFVLSLTIVKKTAAGIKFMRAKKFVKAA